MQYSFLFVGLLYLQSYLFEVCLAISGISHQNIKIILADIVGCTNVGQIDLGDATEQTISTTSASACRTTCLTRWRNSYKRGFLYNNINPCSSSTTATCADTFTVDTSPEERPTLYTSPCFTTAYTTAAKETITTGGSLKYHTYTVWTDVSSSLSLTPSPTYVPATTTITKFLHSYDVKRVLSPAICTYTGTPTASYDICLSWTFDSASNTCSLYNRVRIQSTRAVTDSDRYLISQNMHCNKDNGDTTVGPNAASLQSAQGCMIANQYIDTGSNLISSTDEENPHSCRRACQALESCAIWVWNSDTNTCIFYTYSAFGSYTASTSNYITGARSCPTCYQGFYIPASAADQSSYEDACIVCPKGYSCPNGEVQACAANTFCGNVSTVSAPAYDENNSSISCSADRSGVGCQHKVCESSTLGKNLLAMSFQDPQEFFESHTYSINELEMRQVLVNVGSDGYGDLAFQIAVTHSISQELINYFNGSLVFPSNEYSMTIYNFDWDCSNSSTWTTWITATAPNTVSIGDKVYLANWQMLWNSDSAWFDPDDWFGTSTTLKNDPISIDVSSQSMKVLFMSQLNITVRARGSSHGRSGVNVYYKLGSDDETVYTATTDENGNLDLTLTDASTTSLTSSVTILGANKTDTTYDVRMCPLGSSTCPSTYLSFPQTLSLQNLKYYTLSLIDINVINLGGTLTTSFSGSSSCAAPNVLISAVDLTADPPTVLESTTTDSDGSFTVEVSNTTVQLLFGANQESLTVSSTADAQVSALLGSSGLVMTSSLTGLEIEYTRTSKLTLYTAATMCEYSIGDVNMSLTVDACPGIVLHRSTSGLEASWDIPSAEYTFDLEFYSSNADIKTNYELQFPSSSSRALDMTDSDAMVDMIYQPDPALTAELVATSIVPFSSCSQGALPFQYIVSGGADIEVQIYFNQTFVDTTGTSRVCFVLPSESTILVNSELAPEDDNVCEATDPCYYNISTASDEESVADFSIYVGEPTNPSGTNLTETVNIEYEDLDQFVRSVTFMLYHDTYWPSGITARPSAELEILVMGKRAMSGSNLINFASAVPLYYLYAPPVIYDSEGSLASKTTAVFTRPFTIESRVYRESVDSDETSSSTTISAGLGGSVSGKISGSASYSSTSGETEITTNTTSKEDSVVTTTTTYTFSQETAGEDIVLYMGTTANLSVTKTLTYHDQACRVSSVSDIGWESKATSLIISTRSECEDSLQTIKDTIALYKDDSDMQSLVTDAIEQRNKWLDLFRHWDDDKTYAQNFPINITASISGATDNYATDTNMLTLSGALGTITFEQDAINTTQNLVDFLAFATSDATTTSSLSEESVAFLEELFSLATSSETSQTYTQTTTVDDTTYATSGDENTITATLTSIEGNELCLEIFQSPFCGSFVYKVCGGQTRCPHVPGTDAIEQFYLEENDNDTLASTLTSDKGSFSFYINLTPMDDDDLELDLTVSMDIDSITGYTAYSIAGATVNSNLDLSVSKSEATSAGRQLVVVQYERLSSKLLSTMATVTVTSSCDSTISDSLTFTLNWADSCSKAKWAGDLARSNATWQATSSDPTLDLESSVADVSLWAAPYVPSSGTPEEADYSKIGKFSGTSYAFTAATSGLVSGRTYFLELRRDCGSRSDPRVGVFDNEGPKLVGWAPNSNLLTNLSAFPIVTFRFDEPIDFWMSVRGVNVTNINQTMELESSFTVSTTLYDVYVWTAHVNSASAAEKWSEQIVRVALNEIVDLYGNVAEKASALVKLPTFYPEVYGTKVLPDASLIVNVDYFQEYADQARSNMLPSVSYLSTPQYQTGSSSQKSTTTVIAATVSCIVVALIIAAAAFVIYRRRRAQVDSTHSGSITSRNSSGSIFHEGSIEGRKRIDSMNPGFSPVEKSAV